MTQESENVENETQDRVHSDQSSEGGRPMKHSIRWASAGLGIAALLLAGCSSTASTNNSVTDRNAAAQNSSNAANISNGDDLSAMLKSSNVQCKSGATTWNKPAGTSPFVLVRGQDPEQNDKWPITLTDGGGTRAVGFQVDSSSRIVDATGSPIEIPRPELTSNATCTADGGNTVFALGRWEEINALRLAGNSDCVIGPGKTSGNELRVGNCERGMTGNAKQRLNIDFKNGHLIVDGNCAFTEGHDRLPSVRVGDKSRSGHNCWSGIYADQQLRNNQRCLFAYADPTSNKYALRYLKESDRNDQCQSPNSRFTFGKLAVLNSDIKGVASFAPIKGLPDLPAVTVTAAGPPSCAPSGKPEPYACTTRQSFDAVQTANLSQTAFGSAKLWNLPVRVAVENLSGAPIGVSSATNFDTTKATSAKAGSDLSSMAPMNSPAVQALEQDESTASASGSPTFARLVNSGGDAQVPNSQVTMRIALTTGDAHAATACAGHGDYTATVNGSDCGYIDVALNVPGGAAGSERISAVKWGCRVGGFADSNKNSRFVEVKLDDSNPGNASSLAAGGFLPLKVVIHDDVSDPEGDFTRCRSVKKSPGSVPTDESIQVS